MGWRLDRAGSEGAFGTAWAIGKTSWMLAFQLNSTTCLVLIEIFLVFPSFFLVGARTLTRVHFRWLADGRLGDGV